MNKRCINLLPWREKEYKTQCYRLYKKLTFITATQILIWGILLNLTQQGGRLINRQQTRLQTIKDESETVIKATRLLQKNGIIQKQQYAVENQYSLYLLDMLAQLPLERGELDYFDFAPLSAQQISLTLQGKALSQAEFEALHRFLKAQPRVKNVRLAQFEPRPNGELAFDLNLTAQTDGTP